MKAFDRVTGSVAPLDRANVDTDQIIPKQFLKSIRRTGFGDYLFDAWRFMDEGDIGMTPNEREINRDFVLNHPQYQGAAILLAGENFGCGSSREHAVWALMEFGFRCVIAPSFADIFYNNCFKNGLLPVTLEQPVIDELFAHAQRAQGLELTVDLVDKRVLIPGREPVVFEIAEHRREKMLSGLDDIELSLAHADAIRTFEISHQQRMPWLFGPAS